MAEGVISRLSRQYRSATIPTFQRQTLLSLIPSENIGDRDVTKWAMKIMKETSEPTVTEAGSNWNAAEDKFDFDDMEFVPYKFEKRVTMNRSEMALFEKNNILPSGIEDIWTQFANAANYRLFRGAKATDQFKRTQYNFITDHSASSTTYARPSLITNASAAGDWVDDPGAAQKEIALGIGSLEQYGFNAATTIAFIPEVVAPYFRMPVVTGSSIYGDISLEQYTLNQGIMGVVKVKDEDLYTAAGATPTKDAWDMYFVDMSKMAVGYVTPESTNVTPASAVTNYNTWIDNELCFCPTFIPRKYDTDGYIYKGVSRITAIDMSD